MSVTRLIGSAATKIATRFDDRQRVFYAADVVLFGLREGRWHVLLIERGHAPYRGRLALPGGHVDAGETSLAAARREAVEETGLDLTDVSLVLVGVYDAPGRDPRGRYVSAAYVGTLAGELPAPIAGDDAARATWVPVGEVLYLPARLAFDHHRILRDAARLNTTVHQFIA